MRKICLSLVILLLLTTAACSPSYRSDVPVSDLADLAISTLDPAHRFVQAEQNYLGGYFRLDDHATAQAICFSADGNRLDEFGIFYSDQPYELRDELEDYLEDSLEENRTFYDSYIPEETPKLRDADVKIFGNCVAYAILSPEQKKEFFRALEEKLRQ